MEAVALAARLSLAAVFAVSAGAKLLDRAGTRRAVQAFGLPAGAVSPVAAGLPLAEAVTSVLLVPGTTARFGGFLALGLLAAFIGAIAMNLAQGRHPDCACFGQLSSAPVGPATIARNLVLATAAGLVAFGDGARAGGALGDASRDLDAGNIVAMIVVAASVLVALLASGRKGATLIAEPPAAPVLPVALPVGSDAPPFTLEGTSGSRVALADLLARGRKVLVVFFSPACAPCADIAPELARWQRELSDRLTVAVLTSGTAEKAASNADTYGLSEILLDERSTVAKAYGSRGTPGAVLLEESGTVASEFAAGEAAINDLIIEAFGLTDVVAAVASAREAQRESSEEHAEHDGHEHQHAAPEVDHEEPTQPLVDPASIDASFVPVARPDVTMAEHDGETVLVDEATGAVHLLNPTAAIVWQCLDGTGSVAEIAADIADVFGQSQSEVTGSVLEVVHRFGNQGLLRGVGVEREEAAITSTAGEEHAHE